MNDNREILKAILAGQKPVLSVCLMQASDTVTRVGWGKFKVVPNDQVATLVEQIRIDNPLKQVVLRHIDRNEFEQIAARLEKEY